MARPPPIRPPPELITFHEPDTARQLDPVDYTDYRPHDFVNSRFNYRDDLFQGVLRYIFFKSGNQYNQTEIRFGYKTIVPNSDPTSVLDPRTPTVFETAATGGEFLSVQFHRIRVRPTAYSLRTGPHVRGGCHITGQVFEGQREDGRWITLDERHFPGDMPQHFLARLLHLDTDEFFGHFRIKMTNRTCLALSGFEIHGEVDVREECRPKYQEVEPADREFDPYDVPEFDG
jgi:hypothetical protein